MNKWLLLTLGIVSILLLAYLSFDKKATIIKEDLLKKAEIIHQNSAFKDVYVKLKGDGFSLTRELMLLGTVSSKEDKVLASNLLQDIKGVTKVNNLLKVQKLKPIIKEVVQEKQKVEIPTIEINEVNKSSQEKNSSLDSNKTQIIQEDTNISKEENENNTTELNTTKKELIKNIETNQSHCQEQLNNLLSKSKIHFAHSSSNIEKDSYQQLDQISTILKACSNRLIVIDGYSDNSGEAKYNQRLSQQRANKVRVYLISKGLNKKSIKAFGHGEENPLASNATKEGREKNRRIEFSIKGTK